MPRVAKTAKGGAPVPQKAVAKKKAGYIKSEKIPLDSVLIDLSKKQWNVGPVIGSGGFGDIYCARKAGSSKKKADDYDCVIKIEPHGNGPLFVEMHFYMRNAKLEDIKEFCRKKKLKAIGMPYIIGSGSHVLKDVKHRFLVMPRYGRDVWSFFLANNKCLPQQTVYRLAIQMLDVYEYIHSSSYVHADLKGANILLEYPGNNPSQAYLVDFGLASHYTTKDYKPDPRKMHNGTIEYTSRDAHNGVPTMRGDFEILGYNLVHWSGTELPWETAKLLAQPAKVQTSKEDFMKDVTGALNKLFNKNTPAPIKQFMEYVQSMEYNETPDYKKCQDLFHSGLKTLRKTNSGPLEMTMDKSTTPAKGKLKRSIVANDSGSDSDDAAIASLPIRRAREIKTAAATSSKRKASEAANSPTGSHIPSKPSTNGSPKAGSPRKRSKASPKLKITPQMLVSSSSSANKLGKTIINDNTTPNPGSKKTYEFNFELDVSLDANIVVNVKRKKKASTSSLAKSQNDEGKENVTTSKATSDSVKEIPASSVDSPMPRVHVRRLRTSSRSPRSPVISPRVTGRRVK